MNPRNRVKRSNRVFLAALGLWSLSVIGIPPQWRGTLSLISVARGSEPTGDVRDGYDAQKKEMLARQRRVILNNDGGDATVARPNLERPRDFLDIRTTPLFDSGGKSHVDTICYCTSRNFGTFVHGTKVGTTLTTRSEPYTHNVVPALLEQGTDPLEVMADYCHENGVEIFWSMRMNDTHDAGRPERFRRNKFKVENQQCLLGSMDDRPQYGGWSAVNYSCKIVRDLLRDVVEEVCRNYDVDGIELDFFRHPVFFEQTSKGKPVSDDERAQMTELIRDVARIVEQAGRGRGKPFLIAARTPDDVAYCRTIGLEIERWMDEGLIDIWIPSGYFRLNSWEHNVQLGHENGVQVYPGLSETRVGGGHHAHAHRASDESYRARSAAAWNAGADGIYIFNLFDPHRKIWADIGDPVKLSRLDKVYFASVRGVGRVAGGAYPHQHFNRIPTVNPDAPAPLPAGERKAITIWMGDELAGIPAEKLPDITLSLQLEPNTERLEKLTVAFNGNELTGKNQDKWIHFPVAPGDLRAGENTVEFHYTGKRDDMRLADVVVSVDHSGALLKDESYLERTRERM